MAQGGFDKKTITFLRAVRRNNSSEWFDEHREDYHEYFVEAGKWFVRAAGTRLAKIAPEIVADPRVDGSIFRITRDARFTKDKRPYKDYLDLRFWEGDRSAALSSFFVRIAPEGVTIGAGCHRLDAARRTRFRECVADEESGAALHRIALSLERAGYALEGERLKRIPKPYSEEGPAARFLRHDALFAHHFADVAALTAPDFVMTCVKHWRKLAPLHRWLVDRVQ